MIWDIDKYIENNNWNYINYEYDKWSKTYSIKADDSVYDFFNWDNFKIEKKKDDLPFYDLDINIEFFDRFYFLIGIIPYNENPLEIPFYSEEIWRIQYLIENIESRLLLFNNTILWSRGFYSNIKKEDELDMLLIEEKVKDWIIAFLSNSRKQWEFTLKEESIEKRNFRLLCELENHLFLLKNKWEYCSSNIKKK